MDYPDIPDTKKITMNIDFELWRTTKHKAIELEKDFTQVVIEALKIWNDSNKNVYEKD